MNANLDPYNSNKPKESPKVEAQTDLGVGDALLQLREGMKLLLPHHTINLIGRSEHDSKAVEAPHETFQLLSKLGFIVIENSPMHGKAPYPIWRINPELSHIKFDHAFSSGFIQGLLDYKKPLRFSQKQEFSQAQVHLASSVLLVFAEAGNAAGIKRALEMGADPNAIVDSSRSLKLSIGMKESSALMLACWNGPDAYEGVKALLEAGADSKYKIPIEKGSDVLAVAVAGCARYDHYKKNAEPLIDLLVAYKANPTNVFTPERSYLHLAVNEYDGVISDTAVRALLKHGADPNSGASAGSDVLSHLAWSAWQNQEQGNIAAVEALVLAGANPNPFTNPVKYITSTPLGAACLGSVHLVEFLLQHGASANIVDEKGTTLLEIIKGEKESEHGGKLKPEQKEIVIKLLEDALKKENDRSNAS